MPDQTINFLFLAFERVLVWFADTQHERDFTDLIKGVILGLFEMYTLCICVCVCTMYTYVFISIEEEVQLQILAHLGWMQPSCQDEAHLYYMKWCNATIVRGPFFLLEDCSEKSILPFLWAFVWPQSTACLWWTFLKKGVLLRPSVKIGKHLQIHLHRSVIVQSSQKQFRLKGASGDLWSSLLKTGSGLSQTRLLRAEKALLVQMNTKLCFLSVFSSPPLHISHQEK